MIRFFLVPVETLPHQGTTRRGPMYLAGSLTPLVSGRWEARDYEMQPTMLVAVDASDAEAASTAAQGNVTRFADGLNSTLGGRLPVIQAALEAVRLPAQMLTTTTTDRQVIRGIIGCILLAQAMQGHGRNIFAGGVTLATRMNQLSVAVRSDLVASAHQVGFGAIADAATGSTTVRTILTQIAQAASPSPMLGVTV